MRWKNILGIALLLLVGFLMGASFDQYFVTPRADSNQRSRSTLTSRLEEELIRELKLNDQQQVVLQQAIEDARGKLRQLRREYYPRVSEILKEARDSIVPLLSDEQLELREEMIRREEERHKERERKRSDRKEGNQGSP